MMNMIEHGDTLDLRDLAENIVKPAQLAAWSVLKDGHEELEPDLSELTVQEVCEAADTAQVFLEFLRDIDGGEWYEVEQRWVDPENLEADAVADLSDLLERLYDRVAEIGYDEPTMIARHYFEEYAEEMADDIGAIDRDARWPLNHIDWKAAAEELEQDYSEVILDGQVYLIRQF